MNLTDRSDAVLVAGPPDEFGELFERHARTLYDYCARRVGRQQAEDLVAETFLVAFARRERYDPAAASARPWLFGILTNLLRSHHRTETRGWRALARAGSDPGSPPVRSRLHRAKARLRAAVPDHYAP